MAGEHLLYALAWASFGLGHSLLAADAAKARLGRRLGRWYRLAYNAFALLHFTLVAWVGHALLGDAPPFALPDRARTGLLVLHLLGWAVFIAALRHYDLGRLLGTSQLRHPAAPEDEELRLDGLHRYVRHPLYLGGFMILWGLAMSPLGLATAVWGSAYLLIGTWFEERKLVRLYGRRYLAYRERVPAFLPWKGRV